MMRLLLRSIGYFTFTVILLFAVGCVDPPIDLRTHPTTIQDETLVSGKPCLPPCWYGIIFGETNTEESLKVVQQLPFVDSESVEETTKDLFENTDNSILWNYLGTSDFGGRLFLREDNVVWGRVSYPNYLKLTDIVAIIGEPDWVWARRAGGAGTEYIYRFYFRRRGLWLESRMYGAGTRQNGQVLLSPEIEISGSRYFRPQPLEGYLVNIVGASEEQSARIKELYRPWPGFGEWIEIQPEY